MLSLPLSPHIPRLEVHPANDEGGNVDAGGEVVQVVKDTRSDGRRGEGAGDRVWQSLDSPLLVVEDEHVLVNNKFVIAGEK